MLSRLVPVVSLLLIFAALCFAQSAAKADSDVHVTKLVIPAYPAIARGARVSGDMELTLVIGAEGQVESAVIDRGPALRELRQVVLDAARQSHFECPQCGQKPQTYSLHYRFETKPIDPETYCRTYGKLDPPPVEVDTARDQITVYAWEEYTCDPAVEVKRYRSPKCFYFWNCGRKE